MKRLLVAGVIALAAMVAMPQTASAVPFTGQVDYTGTHTADNADLTVATSTNINQALVVIADGDFGAFLTPFVTFLVHTSPIAFRPAGTPYTPLWSHASGIVFDLTSLSISFEASDELNLVGSGVFKCVAPCAGFDDTEASWNMTLNTAGGVTGSFSSSSTVPEPGLLALFGLGLLGVARRYTRS